MHSITIGFRYASSRWLALSGLSLVLFLLVFIDFPVLGTLVVRPHKHTCIQGSHTYHPIALCNQQASEANKFRF
jgi:hypothetical protein